MKSNSGRRKRHLSVDDIDKLIEMSEEEKVRKFWQTIKNKETKSFKTGLLNSWYRRFISIPVYNNFVIIIFVFSFIYFIMWFLFNYTNIYIPAADITQIAPILAFVFIALIFHKYVSDKEEIFDLIDKLAGYSIQNENVFENIGIALIVVDNKCKITKVNQKAEEILGLKSHEILGNNYKEVFPKENLGELLVKTIQECQGIDNFQMEFKNNKNRRLFLQVTTSLIQNRRGNTIGAIELINDVTEIHELQEKLKLNEHLASIGELSAKLSHEIGNSLGGIRLFTENLLDELPQDTDARSYALEIISGIDKLKHSINDLKNYSRPIQLDLKNADINRLINDVIMLNMDKISNNGITVQKNLNENLPEIMIDTEQIKGAIVNIVLNAIQAMPNGGELNISTCRLNGDVIFSIKDTGEGIPWEIKDKIFKPFFTTKKALGTGLGLSIAYKAIKSHGGNIRFDSEVGKGTAFTIGIPVNANYRDKYYE